MSFLDEWVGKVWTGDCLEFMAHLPDGCVDAVITDPPYGVGACRNNDPPTADYLGEMLRVASGPVVMFGGGPVRSLDVFLALRPDRVLIWSPAFQLGQPASNGMFWSWHPLWCWRLPKDQAELPRDVLRCPTDAKHHEIRHEAAKPVRLMQQLVRAFSPEGGVVLDPYLGSGTTAVACEIEHRAWLGCEIDGEMAEMATKRILRAREQLPLLRPEEAETWRQAELEGDKP